MKLKIKLDSKLCTKMSVFASDLKIGCKKTEKHKVAPLPRFWFYFPVANYTREVIPHFVSPNTFLKYKVGN